MELEVCIINIFFTLTAGFCCKPTFDSKGSAVGTGSLLPMGQIRGNKTFFLYKFENGDILSENGKCKTLHLPDLIHYAEEVTI